MGLREIAEADLAFILENPDTGNSVEVFITPAGSDIEVGPVVGRSSDIGQLIDPDTGVAVSGRRVTITLRLTTLQGLGLEIPRGILDTSITPWLFRYSDILGRNNTFVVDESMPDIELGIVSCTLSVYDNG